MEAQRSGVGEQLLTSLSFICCKAGLVLVTPGRPGVLMVLSLVLNGLKRWRLHNLPKQRLLLGSDLTL